MAQRFPALSSLIGLSALLRIPTDGLSTLSLGGRSGVVFVGASYAFRRDAVEDVADQGSGRRCGARRGVLLAPGAGASACGPSLVRENLLRAGSRLSCQAGIRQGCPPKHYSKHDREALSLES